MRKLFLLFVLALLRSAFGNVTRIKNCDDCTPIFDCKVARDLTQTNESESNDQLLEAFCGFQINKLPKVCCSMLSNAQLTTPTSDSDSVEDHPNLRLLPANCSDTEPIRNLLGGYYAQLYEFPWIALISYRTRVGLQFRCSGSLINERYVLTAAHCIQPNIIGVRIGEFDIDNYSDCEGVPPYQRCEAHVQDVRVEESVAHPGYQFGPSYKNDIGLIRLKKPVDLTFKNCDDCTSISNCEVTSVLIQKHELESDDQLRETFCGFEDNKFPKVCCSMLSNAQLTTPTPDSDSVEDHPNLRLLPQNCSDNVPSRLLGGLPAEHYEYPWMVLIAYYTREGTLFRCSGSLINERYVLTAAHCILTNIAGVRIGELYVDTDFEFIDRDVDCEGVPPFQRCETHILVKHAKSTLERQDCLPASYESPSRPKRIWPACYYCWLGLYGERLRVFETAGYFGANTNTRQLQCCI